MKIHNRKTGFTIVELLISTTILSVILVSASFILVQVGRLYYKGVITARTQDASRSIIESIARPAQLEGSTIIGPSGGPLRVLCIGNQRFSYVEKVLASGVQPVFLRDKVVDKADCATPVTAVGPGVESLLSNNMQIVELDVSQSDSDGMITINVTVAYGEDIQNDGSGGWFCTGQASSSQWCAVAAYSTTIYPRVGI